MARKSKVSGIAALERRLSYIADAAHEQLDAANLENARTLQRHVIAHMSFTDRTGDTRAAFSDPSAIRISRKHKGGWQFGLVSKHLRKLGWKAHFIEFGTKGYTKGDRRRYETYGEIEPQRLSKSGKPIGRPRKGVVIRSRAVDRTVPARPARPFFRPGIEAARNEILGRWKGAIRRAIDLGSKRNA
ncbi:MAG: hypothetical protein SV862_00220 [Pseudomonadota bacterium]|nr:hypothetical protein [Pseudomonadota bacterium]